jgi:microcystin-dependent protein
MSEPFLAEVRIWALNFPPRGWAFCDGQLLDIAQNTALFSLLGTTYGGDGRTNFGLPNLKGRAPMHAGNGPGLTSRRLGDKSGSETVTLSDAQMPAHNHAFQADEEDIDGTGPVGNYLATGNQNYDGSANTTMADVLPPVGGGQPHNNLQPYLVLNFTIALLGLYPSHN